MPMVTASNSVFSCAANFLRNRVRVTLESSIKQDLYQRQALTKNQ